ncbi:MAG TPA: sortase [Patescibacteria group bacterium]|nr:sortase [Patescibacteria group bacterium]
MRKAFANLLILLGLIGFGAFGYLIWERNSSVRLQFNQAPEVQNSSLISGNVPADFSNPTILRIPSIDSSLPIIPSKIVNNRWESTKKGVSYLETSPVPGEIGNSIIYGHNFPNLLKSLTKVKPDDEIYVDFASGATRKFVVHFTQEVGPYQSSILNPTEDRRITLYTCSGFFDTKRFVVTAILSE